MYEIAKNSSSVTELQILLAKEREQCAKLKSKLKNYATRIAAMEVDVAEAYLIKQENGKRFSGIVKREDEENELNLM